MKLTRKISVILAALLVLAMVAACGTQSAPSPSPVESAEMETPAEEANAPATSPEGEEAAGSYAADVIVVGAGGAGMSAAIEATRAGASVIVLEKSGVVGGNTLPAQSGINAVDSVVQEASGNTATIEDFMERHMNDLNNEELVRFMGESSAGAIDFLRNMGLELTVSDETTFSHRADGPIGPAVVEVLNQTLRESGAALLFDHTAMGLIVENGAVTGVIAHDAAGKEMTFKANAVVLATGGFGQDNDLVAQYAPTLKGAITDEIAPTTGDGLLMAQAIGADTVDLGEIQTFPTVEVNTHSMLFPNLARGNVIYVNDEGQRFVTENWGDPEMLAAVMQESIDGTAYLVFDAQHLAAASGLQDFIDRGAAFQGETPTELAESMGVNVDNLAATFETWNADVASGADNQFGREEIEAGLTEAPYYAIPFGVGVHYCRGGLVIDTLTQVQNTSGEPIPGLYASGEVTGGVHGAERVDGSAVTDTIVYGRQSGIQSAAYALSKGSVELRTP